MSDDLAKRLDLLHSDLQGRVDAPKLQLIEEAKARIEALEAQIAEARELLREFVAAYPYEDMGHVAVIHDDARALLARMGD
jgi:hypothetical protein